MSNRKAEIKNRKRGTILEMRILCGKEHVTQDVLVYGASAEVTVAEDCRLQLRERKLATGVPTSWETVIKAVRKTVKNPNKKKTDIAARGKTSRKGSSAHGKRSSGKAKKSKTGAKRPKCSVCGKRVKNLMKHRWKEHRALQLRSMKKTKRKKNLKKKS